MPSADPRRASLHRIAGDVPDRPQGLHAVALPARHFGCCVMRRYGLGAFHPCGNCFFASSSLTEPAMITSCPCFQLAGVATLCLAVSWIESRTRRTSSKLRPVVMG